METAAVRIRMPGGVGGTAVMSRLPTRLATGKTGGLLVKTRPTPTGLNMTF